MDRRQLKTRKAIFQAFRSLLVRKRYDHITVGDITEEANVGRSTFYAHFETKDLLLDAMCDELFHHIFENTPCPWKNTGDGLEGELVHTLFHIRESQNDLSGILLSDSSELFLRYFKDHLRIMFSAYIDTFHADVPKDFLLNHLVGSFSETVTWWIKEGMRTSPEDIAKYFLSVIETH